MTLITITTVGYAEVVPIEGFPARLFTGAISLAGFGAVTFLFTSLAVFFLERDLDYTPRRRRMEKQIGKLRQHYIICGFGRVGRNVAHELKVTHRQFVAIDIDEGIFADQREAFLDLLFLQGDGSDDDLLVAADITDAAGVFAVTGDDSRNLMIALTAKQLNPATPGRGALPGTAQCRRSARQAPMSVSPDFTGGMPDRLEHAAPACAVPARRNALRSSEATGSKNSRCPMISSPAPAPGCASTAKRSSFSAEVGREFMFNPSADFFIEPGQVIVAMCSPAGRLCLRRPAQQGLSDKARDLRPRAQATLEAFHLALKFARQRLEAFGSRCRGTYRDAVFLGHLGNALDAAGTHCWRYSARAAHC